MTCKCATPLSLEIFPSGPLYLSAGHNSINNTISGLNGSELQFIKLNRHKLFKNQLLHYVPPGLTFSNSMFCPPGVFMCFVWIWEQTAIIFLYSIDWLVCLTETECIYCVVWTGSLYIMLHSAPPPVYLCVLCGSENKQQLFSYTALTDWFL